MGKGLLIDSNVVIAYLDNKLSHYGMEFTSTVIDEVPNISVVTQIEVKDSIPLPKLMPYWKIL